MVHFYSPWNHQLSLIWLRSLNIRNGLWRLTFKLDYYSVLIDDLGISVVPLHGVANSSQTYIKHRGLGCDVGTTTIRKLYRFDHEIVSQVSFPNFMFRCESFYLSVVWKSWDKKILAHRINTQKNLQIMAHIFWIFTEFYRVMWV